MLLCSHHNCSSEREYFDIISIALKTFYMSGLCVLSVLSDLSALSVLSALVVLSVLMTMITMTTLTTMSTMMIVTMTNSLMYQ